MAYAGQIISHPSLGVTMQFIKTHHETNGYGWETVYTIEPGKGKGKDSRPHTHLNTDEWFRIVSGTGRYWINGRERKLSTGDEIFLPANKPHIHPWNTGMEPLVMRNYIAAVEPGGMAMEELRKMEDYFEFWFHLASRGRVRKDGTPYLLQSAVFLKAVRKQLVLAKIPLFVQDMLIAPLALAGRLLGYKKAVYE